MVFQFLSMSLNFLLNKRGLPGTTTSFPKCNLKSLAIHAVLLVPRLLFILIYLQIILEETAPAPGNRPAFLFFFVSHHLGITNLGMDRVVPSYISQVPLVPKPEIQKAAYTSEQQVQFAYCLLLASNQVSQAPSINEVKVKTPPDRRHSPWTQE